jgi:hypothetical protein
MFQLPPRTARFTGLFYNNDLTSTGPADGRLPLVAGSPLLHSLLHQTGGPVLIPLDLRASEESPLPALNLVQQLLTDLFQTAEPLSIAVFTHRRATSRSLQRQLATATVPLWSLLIVDTVAHVPGLTCDVCLFINLAIDYAHSFQAATL